MFESFSSISQCPPPLPFSPLPNPIFIMKEKSHDLGLEAFSYMERVLLT